MVSLYFLELTDMFKPVRSGFSCNDRSLSLPYIEPTHEAVPFLMLLSLAFAAPAITVRYPLVLNFITLSAKPADLRKVCLSLHWYFKQEAVGFLSHGLMASVVNLR